MQGCGVTGNAPVSKTEVAGSSPAAPANNSFGGFGSRVSQAVLKTVAALRPCWVRLPGPPPKFRRVRLIGKAPVSKAGGRKPIGVRVLYSPPSISIADFADRNEKRKSGNAHTPGDVA